MTSAASALDFMDSGIKNRETGATKLNDTSSRSHATFKMPIKQTMQSFSLDSSNNIYQIQSRVTFVDLAGSENLKRTDAEGMRKKEGIQINKELSCLNHVLKWLSDKQKLKNGGLPTHVPYRDSKLTFLLKEAQAGNSRTIFLACISPIESNAPETLSSLNVS